MLVFGYHDPVLRFVGHGQSNEFGVKAGQYRGVGAVDHDVMPTADHPTIMAGRTGPAPCRYSIADNARYVKLRRLPLAWAFGSSGSAGMPKNGWARSGTGGGLKGHPRAGLTH